MTIKEVNCNNCNKKFSVNLRKYNLYIKNNWKFYCCKECGIQAKTKIISLTCANCGKLITKLPSELKKTKNNFCSRSCAAIFNNKLRDNYNWVLPTEAREKIRNALKKYRDTHPYIPSHKRCIICNKEFILQRLNSGRLSKSNTCSDECHVKLKHVRGIELYKKCVENNTFKGWRTRNIISYPEKFWIGVLQNNNISFEREKYVEKYFLDFVISINNKLIDLEIDGKQHKYKDRQESDKIRDKFLTDRGYIVYRVDWNEINSEKGKKLMKEKISNFLSFIKI